MMKLQKATMLCVLLANVYGSIGANVETDIITSAPPALENIEPNIINLANVAENKTEAQAENKLEAPEANSAESKIEAPLENKIESKRQLKKKQKPKITIRAEEPDEVGFWVQDLKKTGWSLVRIGVEMSLLYGMYYYYNQSNKYKNLSSGSRPAPNPLEGPESKTHAAVGGDTYKSALHDLAACFVRLQRNPIGTYQQELQNAAQIFNNCGISIEKKNG